MKAKKGRTIQIHWIFTTRYGVTPDGRMMFLIYTVLSLKRCGLDNFYRLDTFLLKSAAQNQPPKLICLELLRLKIYPNKSWELFGGWVMTPWKVKWPLKEMIFRSLKGRDIFGQTSTGPLPDFHRRDDGCPGINEPWKRTVGLYMWVSSKKVMRERNG